MTIRKKRFAPFLLALCGAAFVSQSLAAPAPTPGAERPNIVFVLVDDLGWGDVGSFYQNGRADAPALPSHSTPHLDRMAAEGARMTHHYVAAPVCAPSRASFLQGVTQGHANVRDNQFDKALDRNHTLATVLGEAGYATAAIGKWGLQGRGMDGADSVSHPLDRGFDYYYGYISHVSGHAHYPKEMLYFGERIKRNGPVRVWENRADVTEPLDKSYSTDLFTARAKKWIVEQKRSEPEQPFFLYLAYATPHAALEIPTQPYPEGGGLNGGLQWTGEPGRAINTASGVPDSWFHPEYAAATYDHDRDPVTPEMAWPDVYRRYATSVRRIDDSVGDLLQLLKDLEIDENTLVVFATDNGPSIESYLQEPYRADFFDSYGPFDGIKRDLWEGGLRTPNIARWPAAIPAGRVDEKPSAMWDWLPTFAAIAGVPAPARADGVSLLPNLTGQGKASPRESLYFEYVVGGSTPEYEEFEPDRRGRKRGQMQAVRLGDYMGVRYDIQSPEDSFEIYNVVLDPKQSDNLAEEPTNTMRELQARLQATALQSRRPDPDAPRPYDDQAMPAAADSADARPGLVWRSYQGEFPWVPNFAQREAHENGTADSISARPLGRSKTSGLFFEGFLRVPTDGDYTFALMADRGAVMRLHEATVIDADYAYEPGTQVTATVRLKAGQHPIRLHYLRGDGGRPQLDLQWSGPGFGFQTLPATALSHTPD